MPALPRPGVLTVACGAALLVLVNYTMPLGMLSSISANLGASTADRAWVLSGGALGVAASLLPAGSLADGVGRKRTLLVAALGFGLVSVVGALAGSTVVLIAVRVLQGMASGALLAGSLAVIAGTYPGAVERARATGLWGATVGGGIALGPLFGAMASAAGSWRLAYWLLALLGVLVAAGTAVAIEESRATVRRRVDWPGMVTLSAGLGALVAALLRGNPDGWAAPHVIGLLAGAVVLLGAFVAVESRRRQPMMDLGLLRNRGFTAAFLGSLVLGGSVIAFMNVFPTWSEHTGESVIDVALQLLLWSGPSAVVAVRADLIARVMSPYAQTVAGMGACLLGLLVLLGVSPTSPWHLVPSFLILGIGTGMLNAALARAAIDTVPAASAGLGAGANNTARYIGNALGVAALTAIAATPGQLTPALIGAAAVAGLGVLVALFVAERPGTAPAASRR